MNHIWSDNIQGIETLYLSRKLRILEIGCGPDALTGALQRWHPNAEIAAVDRDSNFIKYEKENIAGMNFIESDATALPFEADTFDVTISNMYRKGVIFHAFAKKGTIPVSCNNISNIPYHSISLIINKIFQKIL